MFFRKIFFILSLCFIFLNQVLAQDFSFLQELKKNSTIKKEVDEKALTQDLKDILAPQFKEFFSDLYLKINIKSRIKKLDIDLNQILSKHGIELHPYLQAIIVESFFQENHVPLELIMTKDAQIFLKFEETFWTPDGFVVGYGWSDEMNTITSGDLLLLYQLKRARFSFDISIQHKKNIISKIKSQESIFLKKIARKIVNPNLLPTDFVFFIQDIEMREVDFLPMLLQEVENNYQQVSESHANFLALYLEYHFLYATSHFLLLEETLLKYQRIIEHLIFWDKKNENLKQTQESLMSLIEFSMYTPRITSIDCLTASLSPATSN
ncbi:MAG: hypothetical protein KBD63_01320 [Bacteriovoracaceae bacterium]|nr:hypothetical protein [Bacteriovoracaceae bacterium]